MRVLELTSSFPTCDGGPHSPEFVADLIGQLPVQGITPIVLAPHFPGGQFRENLNGILIYRFLYFLPARFERLAYGAGLLFNVRRDFFAFAGVVPFFLAESFWTLAVLYRQRIDLLHTHWLVPQGLIGAMCHRFFSVPHILTIHGSDLNLLKRNQLSRRLCRFIVRNSAIITVNSTYMRDQLEEIVPEFSQRIRIIPMGVDLKKFRSDVKSDIIEKGFTDHQILSVGRLIDWKGTVYLVNAMPIILQRFPHTKLSIIGTGPEEENLKQRVKELSLEDNIIFLGRTSNTDINRYYHSADVFVMPSINQSGNTEALGVVLLEAMSCGCPVVGSDVGGIPDIITDNENGFLVPEKDSGALAEKIILLLSDTQVREKFRKNGLMNVKNHFVWDAIVIRFVEAYHCAADKQDKEPEV
jgi:L-malate glycosyltransferase